ncbi:MAG: hypothetical protein RLZ98_1677 [Pseudomonadota bacterium]|jgi:carbamoyltransferase
MGWTGPVRILGLVTATHDSGIALLRDGLPELVLEEERLNRIKHTRSFPDCALAEGITARGLRLADFDVITTPWNPALLRQTVGREIASRLPLSLNLLRQESRPVQSNDIVILNYRIKRRLKRHFAVDHLPPIVNVGHHDSHAASFYVSPFEEAAVLVMDGYGDDASTSLYMGRGNHLERRWKTDLFNSLGMVYTFVTHYLGFGGFADEGKVMAMAAYGEDTYVERFRQVVRPTGDGRYQVDLSYFDYHRFGMIRPFTEKFFRTFGPQRLPDEPLEQRHFDMAKALQVTIEEVILHMVRQIGRETGSRRLCLAGGVALNCVANDRIRRETDFKEVWVPPVASDSGAPLGSTLWYYHKTLGKPRGYVLEDPGLGLEYDDERIVAALRQAGVEHTRLDDRHLIERTADALAEGKIVGWFQGRFEIGPRALGYRSILADPRHIDSKALINDKIKRRESFRPFAPAVLLERANEFFEFHGADPFMTMAPKIRSDKRHLIAAAVHVDGTGRIQTVDRRANPRYYDVIEAFGQRTGVPVLLNTSFNRHEPIVSTPEEAISCFLRTGMDVLSIGNYFCAAPDNATRDNAARAFADAQARAERNDE